jgi:hypothetical protein
MYSGFMFRRSMKPNLPMTPDLPVFLSSKKWRHKWKCDAMPRVGLAEVDEGGDNGDQVQNEVYHLDV